MFHYYSCKDIDSEKRVTDDLEIECWGAEHIWFSLSIAVPSLIIWGFGIPLFAWIVLARNSDELELTETREKIRISLQWLQEEILLLGIS